MGKGVWRWGERESIYTYHYTVTTRMTPALRWAAVTAILMFHYCDGQSHKTVSTDHNVWRERRAEADSNRGPSAYQPNALPLGQTGSQVLFRAPELFYKRGFSGASTVSVLRFVVCRTAERAPFTGVSRSVSRCMGAAMFYRDCASLAVLHWVASRFLV